MSYTRANGHADEHELDELPLDGSHTETHESKTTRTKDAVLSAWWWELMMMVVSFVAFLALLIILGIENGREYRRWGFLTLNAVNTILTTVTVSSMTAFLGSALSQNMWNAFAQRRKGGAFLTRPATDLKVFDEASRGPMGSLLLLTRRRIGTVAAVGAVVTVFNLAFATFTQQLISTEIFNVKVGTARPFARSESYSPAIQNNAYDNEQQPGYLDYRTVAAIIGAGMQGNNALPLAPKCQTDNCTYPTMVPTLAVCGGCTNVTDKLDNQGTCEWTNPPCNKSITTDCGAAGKPCTYSLPTGPSLTFQPGISGKDLYAIWNATNLLSVPGNGYAASTSIAYDNDGVVYPMKFATIGLPPSQANSFVADTVQKAYPVKYGSLPPMQAHECAIWFCLNYYEITVINGTVYMKLAGSYSRLEGTSSKPNNGLLQFLDDDGYLVTKQPYGVDSNTADTISEVTANLVPAGESYVRPYWQNGLYYFGQANSTLNMIEGLWRKSDNLQNWTVNLAQGFTNNLAVVSPAPATDEYDGIALQPQTHFKIRWYWISLPVLVLLLSYLFLIATIVQTERRIVSTWQSNALALAATGVDDGTRAQLKQVNRSYSSLFGTATDKVRIGLRKRASGEMVFSSEAPM